MTRLKLEFVHAFIDRHGKPRHYFRRHGKRVRLRGLPGSTEFMTAYQAALDSTGGVKTEVGASRTVQGTVNATIVAFYQSYGFTKNRLITQQTDRNILEAFRLLHGDKPIAFLERRHIEMIIAEKAGKPSAQRNLLRVLRVLLDFAMKEKLRRDNPALGIKLYLIKTTGYHSWTEAELRQYEDRHPVGTKARLALDLLLYTAERRKDVVALGPANMRNGRFTFIASKNGAELDIPVAQPLAATIAATPMIGVKSFLITEYGKPFTPAGFGNWFRDRCDEAGLPQCSAHGLRKAFLRRMAEAGCSEDYIASISGHRDTREIRKYVQAANKAKMATDGMARTLAHFPRKTEK